MRQNSIYVRFLGPDKHSEVPVFILGMMSFRVQYYVCRVNRTLFLNEINDGFNFIHRPFYFAPSFYEVVTHYLKDEYGSKMLPQLIILYETA